MSELKNSQIRSSTLSRRQIEVLSGLSAGFATTIITHPLDLIKIRLQLSIGQDPRPFQSLRNVIKRIHKDGLESYKRVHAKTALFNPQGYKAIHMLRQYYRGISPNLLGNIIAWGLYFTLYAESKHHIKTSNETFNYFGSSILAGISTSVMTNPIWVLKTRILGTSREEPRAYSSTLNGVIQIFRNEGILSFWKGTIPSMFSVLQGSLQFTFYDHMKSYWTRRRKLASEDLQLSTPEYLYSSSLSKVFSMVIMYPAQIVKSRLQYYNNEEVGHSIRSVIRHLWYEEGRCRAFYKGVSANIVRVLPATCITFLTYEKVKDQLQKI